jgi:hemoglobin
MPTRNRRSKPLSACCRYSTGANLEDQDVYNAVGDDGFRRLVGAFYRRVPLDDLLGAMYPKDDLAGAEQRLRDFLIFRFGGPPRYIEDRGHPRLRMRHARFPVNQAARDRWLALMTSALDEAQFPPEVRQILASYFESTATAMMNRD